MSGKKKDLESGPDLSVKKGDKDYHFLVVDDDDEARSTVVEYLRTLGYTEITQAKDGAEAYRKLELDTTINFIISDWDMPMMNGLEFLQRIRTNPHKAHLPFLICTSPVSQEAEKIIMAAENLVDSYIIKPFRMKTLEDKLSEISNLSVHGPQRKIVVADDDPEARKMVIEFLGKFGFKEIESFENGRDALEFIQRDPENVGLVVADWEMPEITGLELLRAMKSQQRLTHIPFLMITSQGSMERMKVIRAAKASVDQYLLKPFTSKDLKERVEMVLERSRNRGEIEELMVIGMEALERGRYEKASDVFESVLSLDPDHDGALRGYADSVWKSRGVESAMPYMKKAVESNPYSVANYVKLSQLYEQVQLVDKAIALLQTGLKHVSFSAELHFRLAELFVKRQMFRDARKHLEKTLEVELGHERARMLLEVVMNHLKG